MKRLVTYICIFIGGMLLTACHHTSHQVTQGEDIPLAYAKLLKLTRQEGYMMAEICNPWDTTRLLQRYILLPHDAETTSDMPSGTIVRVPLQQTVVFSGVHCGLFKQIGALPCIAGVCDLHYIRLEDIHELCRNGQIADFGNGMSPDLERLIERHPDALFVSPFENSNFGPMEQLGIPIITCAEYMENSPLGRADWIHFYGLLTGHEAEADSLFRVTEQHYLALKAKTATVHARPTVLSERRVNAVWYVSGGLSSTAQLYADAGASYVFDGYHTANAIPIDFETAFDKGGEADFWFFKYNEPYVMTYHKLADEYAPYTQFKAFSQRHVYVCNTATSSFYEDTAFRPDLILQDFITVMHPEVMSGSMPVYFKPMEP